MRYPFDTTMILFLSAGLAVLCLILTIVHLWLCILYRRPFTDYLCTLMILAIGLLNLYVFNNQLLLQALRDSTQP